MDEFEVNGKSYFVEYESEIENYSYCEGDNETPPNYSGNIVVTISKVSIPDEFYGEIVLPYDEDLWDSLKQKIADSLDFFELCRKK